MPICAGCGGSFSESFQFCPYCGRANVQAEAQKVVIQETSEKACPRCQLVDKVEKASEIRRYQTQHLEGTVPVSHTYSDNKGHVHSFSSRENFSGTQTTQLADALRPPVPPKIPKKHPASTIWLLIILLYIGCFAIGLTFYDVVVGGANENVIGFLIQLVVFIPLFLLWKRRYDRETKTYPTRLAKAQFDLNAYSQAIRNWDNLYYCYRDGCVFIPGQNSSAHVGAMLQYIYNPK